jgi:hypothetical protein
LRKHLILVSSAFYEGSIHMRVLCMILLAALSFPNITLASSGSIVIGGTWQIQEEERAYIATLDESGNGTYTWQDGRITTTELSDGQWRGTWQQPGNDREGGFEIVLAPDGATASGKWWYTRVGKQAIPSGEWGGNFIWTRVTP